MYISKELVDELWKKRLPAPDKYMRTPGRIKENWWLLLVLLVLPAMVFWPDQQAMLLLGLGCGLNLISAIIIYRRLSRIRAGGFREKYSYQLSSLLYSIYDSSFILYVGAIFWDMGMWSFSRIGLGN